MKTRTVSPLLEMMGVDVTAYPSIFQMYAIALLNHGAE